MKRLPSLLILSALNLSAAITALTQWDVRTTGSDTNGGGFDGTLACVGTDYSQQNSAQIAYTDLVIGATNTQLTSSGNPFTTATCGNIINITSGTGFTVGRYQVVSVSGSTATMDRAVGTAASTGGNGNLGGSLATLDPFVASGGPLTVTSSAGQRVWIKSGTYTRTTRWNASNLLDVQIVTFEGYNTTHGDRGTKPLITTATNSLTLMDATNNVIGSIVFRNISFSNTAGTRGIGFIVNGGQTNVILDGCIMDGFTYHVLADNNISQAGSATIIGGSELKNATTDGISTFFTSTVSASWLHNNAGSAVLTNSTSFSLIVENSVFSANGVGINSNALTSIRNSAFVSNTGDGVTLASTAIRLLKMTNNAFYGNGGYGFNVSALDTYGTVPVQNTNNAYGSNTSGDRHNLSVGLNDVALTANPFTSSSNFALNSTTGGGAAMKQAGYPGVAPFGTGYLDIGPVQSQSSSSSGACASVTIAMSKATYPVTACEEQR